MSVLLIWVNVPRHRDTTDAANTNVPIQLCSEGSLHSYSKTSYHHCFPQSHRSLHLSLLSLTSRCSSLKYNSSFQASASTQANAQGMISFKNYQSFIKRSDCFIKASLREGLFHQSFIKRSDCFIKASLREGLFHQSFIKRSDCFIKASLREGLYHQSFIKRSDCFIKASLREGFYHQSIIKRSDCFIKASLRDRIVSSKLH